MTSRDLPNRRRSPRGTEPSTGEAPPVGIVITVFRGGCEVAFEDRIVELRLVGRHALQELELAVGDEVTFDLLRGIVLERLERRTRLVRRRPRDDPRREQVISANMDWLAIVVAVAEPRFSSGFVDRFLLAAFAGGLGPLLVVNKIDLCDGEPLPAEIQVFETIVPVFPVSARTGEGLEALRVRLARSRTVLAGPSGAGKSSLLNALDPELRLETGELSRGRRSGRHTTARATLLRLPGDAIVVDTPGVREVATGPVDPSLLERVYPDVARLAAHCQFRDCRHDREPDCAVRAAAEGGELHGSRYASYRRLIAEIRDENAASRL